MAEQIDIRDFEAHVERFLQVLDAYLLGDMRKGGFQLQAMVSSQMDFTQPAGESFRTSKRLGIESGDLSRALIPGKPGNVFRLEGNLARGYTTEYGIDGKIIPYSLIHEYGGFIKHKGKMPYFLFHLARETGYDKYRIIGASALAKGGVDIKAKPYFNPGVDLYEQKVWSMKLETIIAEMALIWEQTQ